MSEAQPPRAILVSEPVSADLGRRRGIALPVIFGLILCMGFWIGSLSWTMTKSRGRFLQVIKVRRAYFMARSALQHFFLKMKVTQKQYPAAYEAISRTDSPQWPLLARSFVEDIVIPQDIGDSYPGKYRIASFTLDQIQPHGGGLAVKIVAEGEVEGATDSITRVQKLSASPASNPGANAGSSSGSDSADSR